MAAGAAATIPVEVPTTASRSRVTGSARPSTTFATPVPPADKLIPERQASGQQADLQSTEHLWGTILKGVSTSRAVPSKNVVVLGDPGSGKSTLIAHLADPAAATREDHDAAGEDGAAVGNKVRKLSSADPGVFGENSELALSYSYAEVRDEDNEDLLAHLGIFQLATSEPVYRSLLPFAINSTTLPDSLVVITLDWTEPWMFVEVLLRWLSVFEEAVCHVEKEGDTANRKQSRGEVVLDDLREKLTRYLQEYTEPLESPDDHRQMESSNQLGSQTVLLPLEEGILTKNFGVPLVVVCCKSDSLHSMNYPLKDEQLDFIQQTLRAVCLQYGATLFYTSQRRPESFSRFREYILHRLLSTHQESASQSSSELRPHLNAPSGRLKPPKRGVFAFPHRAQVIEKDMVVVPAGWDTRGKILLLREGFSFEPIQEGGKALENVFREVIKDPRAHYTATSHTPHITVENEQAFLERHIEITSRGDHGHRASVSGMWKGRRDTVSSIGSTGSAPAAARDTQDDILARLSRLSKSAKGTSATTAQPLTSSTAGQPGGFPSTAASSAASAGIKGSATSASSSSSTQNEVLASFFQSLLNKNSTGTTSPGSSSSANSPRFGTPASSNPPSASGSAYGSVTSLGGGGGGPLSEVTEVGTKQGGPTMSPDSRRQSVAAELSRMKAAARKK